MKPLKRRSLVYSYHKGNLEIIPGKTVDEYLNNTWLEWVMKQNQK